MKYHLCLFVWLLLIPGLAFSQHARMKGQIVSERDGRDAIPNIDDKLSLISLVLNPSVAKALDIEKEDLSKLQAAFQASNGSLSMMSDSKPSSSRAEWESKYASHLAKGNELVDELMTPAQWALLRQLAYQTEVARIGLGGALTDGRLGRDVGIHENQLSHIREKATEIEEKAAAAILKILQDSQAELILALAPDQQKKARECLGSPFIYREIDPRTRLDRAQKPR